MLEAGATPEAAFFRRLPPPRPSRGRLLPRERFISKGRIPNEHALPRERRLLRQEDTAVQQTPHARKRKHPKKLWESELSGLELSRIVCNTLFVFSDLPLVYTLLTQQNFLDLEQSSIVTYLIGKGIVPLAEVRACQDIPLAKRLAYFRQNWEIITTDPWLLQTVSGYRVDFVRPLHQNGNPKQLHCSDTERSCLQDEIEA